MKTSFFSVLFLFIFIISSHAQNTKAIYIKLIDSETSEPISYASVIIKGSTKGVIADYNGEFRIPIQYYEAKNSIVISSIGFETKEKALENFKLSGLNIINLKPQIEALDAVIISSRTKIKGNYINAKELVKASRTMTAKEIVLKAIRKIPENLSNNPHSYIGYYRDYQLVDNEFHNLNEGMFETFDKGISTNFLKDNQNQTVIYDFKRNTNFIQDSSLTKAYNGTTKYIKYSEISPRGGNEYSILNTHNPIRNFESNTFSYVYTLERDFPNLHKFRIDKIVYLNDEPLALIAFNNTEPRDYNNAYGIKSSRDNYVKGTLYISLVDYSIHRFNYKVLVPRTKNILFNVSLEYARQGDFMYLNYITFNNAFVVNEEFELREEQVTFENSDQAFYILFNNTKDKLNFNTVLSTNFKFKLGKRRLKTILTEKISERLIKVTVEGFDGVPIEINKTNIDDVTYTFKNIKDVKGREIYGSKSIEGDQFREFFVQQVNLEKSADVDLNFMIQNLPIDSSPRNKLPDANQYWINTPLMNKKYRHVDH
ncbi:carboxypeptidase-like regulatory domain-containing protein [Psychroserpens sp. MEBiC05023]